MIDMRSKVEIICTVAARSRDNGGVRLVVEPNPSAKNVPVMSMWTDAGDFVMSWADLKDDKVYSLYRVDRWRLGKNGIKYSNIAKRASVSESRSMKAYQTNLRELTLVYLRKGDFSSQLKKAAEGLLEEIEWTLRKQFYKTSFKQVQKRYNNIVNRWKTELNQKAKNEKKTQNRQDENERRQSLDQKKRAEKEQLKLF